MFAGVLRQLKHRRHAFSTKEGFKQMIRIDVPAVLFVLEAILFNVGPEFLSELSAGQWARANYSGER